MEKVIWITKDKGPILGKYTVCMFMDTPHLISDSYWSAEKEKCTHRTPVDYVLGDVFGLKPGEAKQYKITEI